MRTRWNTRLTRSTTNADSVWGHIFQIITLLTFLLIANQASAELRGAAVLSLDTYPEDAPYQDQSDDHLQTSLSAELNARKSLGSNTDVLISLFGKAKSAADQTYSGDIREAWIGYYGTRSEWHAGMLMERWGVLEAESITDIINPRDFVEDFQGDVKLGIPGLSYSYLGESGTLGLWILPYAREARLAQGEDRFRTVPLNVSNPDFENGRNQPSLAARYTMVSNNIELAVGHFYGHSRRPWFNLETDQLGRPTSFRPQYELINQTSLELLWIKGNSLLKLEAGYQRTPTDDFILIGAGIEKEIPRLRNSNASLTFYFEAYYDDRPDTASTPIAPFQQDVFVGARLALNNFSSTAYQFRLTYDLDYQSALLDLRAEHRLNRVWEMEASIYAFINAEQDPALKSLRDDNRVQLKLIRNF